MKNKLIKIISLLCLSAICFGLVACSDKETPDSWTERGYYVSVLYDPNGGKFIDSDNLSIMDLFRPADYEKDSEGSVHIKLTDPTSKKRPTSSTSTSITLKKDEYFFVGWYKERIIKTDGDGSPVDENGVKLINVGDSYHYLATGGVIEKDVTIKDKDNNETVVKKYYDENGNGREVDKNADGVWYVKSSVTPACTYNDLWDFENDTFDYKDSDGVVSLTLYAGWVKNFEFVYYYSVDDGATWTNYNKNTSFDYIAANPEGTESDLDTIYLPRWDNGKQTYRHLYMNKTSYQFPKINNTTFLGAYTDSQCTNEIADKLEHIGTLDTEHAVANDRVMNVYVKLDDSGEQFRISNAQQFVDYADLNGIYVIESDVLDFSGLESDISWPTLYTADEFNGKIYGADNKNVTFKNINCEYADTYAYYGGLFGRLGDKAVIKNVNFENAVFDILQNMSMVREEVYYGLFAGDISDKATINGVTVSGTFRIGRIGNPELFGGEGYYNVLANGKTDGITKGNISLIVYGEQSFNGYDYMFNPENVKIDSEGNITFVFGEQTKPEESYVIQ